MCGYAVIADPYNGMVAAISAQCCTAASGVAFIAWLIGIVKIGAAGALKQITGSGRLIA
jgi:hypothetical protein